MSMMRNNHLRMTKTTGGVLNSTDVSEKLKKRVDVEIDIDGSCDTWGMLFMMVIS